jgi:hypothetical protein
MFGCHAVKNKVLGDGRFCPYRLNDWVSQGSEKSEENDFFFAFVS